MVRFGLLAAAALATPAAAEDHIEPQDDIVVTGTHIVMYGQTVTTVDENTIARLPVTTVGDLVKLAPGVAVMQGNGPRDISVSIRGSNARNGFGARNIVVYEDGFPVTQPDGLARFDLTDPHAYAAVDVVRGPSSARYGNYALGGAIDFRARSGADIDGWLAGADVGTDRYFNFYGAVGHKADGVDYALFGSFVGGDGATTHTRYRTGTINALASWAIDADDTLTAKAIYNRGTFELAARLSYDQYLANPYQQGCDHVAGRVAGCGTISVFANGRNGARVLQTATEGDLARDDQRAIIGLRHTHDFGRGTVLTTQVTLDGRNVYQPTSATPFKGTLNSVQASTALDFGGGGIAVWYGALDNRSFSFAKTPEGRDGFGAPTQTVLGTIANMGARAHAELGLGGGLDVLLGAAVERSMIDMRQTAYAHPVGSAMTQTFVPALRRFWNLAPEAALRWQANDALRFHARVGTGYGIPQSGQLFVTPAGVPGNNTDLGPQRNVGIDLGSELNIGQLRAELTGYSEWFENELVSQSAGINLLSFTTNVPRSRHRGVEFGLGWQSRTGLNARVSGGYTDQRYTEYAERLTNGTTTVVFDRAGNNIPGVIPFFGTARLGYDHRSGVGGMIEVMRRSGSVNDNANQLHLPGYTIANATLHFDHGGGRSLYVSIQNLFDKAYIGSATVIADSIATTGVQNGAGVLRGVGGSIYAGQPRSVFVGLKGHF